MQVVFIFSKRIKFETMYIYKIILIPLRLRASAFSALKHEPA